MSEAKVTKKEMFAKIAAMVADEDVKTFCEKEIAAIDRKALKAKERAAAKAAEGDALMDAVAAVLTDEPMTNADILTAMFKKNLVTECSVNKVAYRTNALAKAGRAVKTEVTVPGEEGARARVLVAYTAAE